MARRRQATIKGTLLLMLVLFVLVCAWSAFRITTEYNASMSAYESMQAKLEDMDFTGAIESEHQLADHLDKLNNEVYGTHWHILGYVPYIGDDIKCAQQLTSVANDLVNNGIDPVISEGEKLVSQGSIDVAGLVTGQSHQLDGITNSIKGARETLKNCSNKVDDIPEPHLQQLKDARQNVQDAVNGVEGRISAIEGIANKATGAISILTGSSN